MKASVLRPPPPPPPPPPRPVLSQSYNSALGGVEAGRRRKSIPQSKNISRRDRGPAPLHASADESALKASYRSIGSSYRGQKATYASSISSVSSTTSTRDKSLLASLSSSAPSTGGPHPLTAKKSVPPAFSSSSNTVAPCSGKEEDKEKKKNDYRSPLSSSLGRVDGSARLHRRSGLRGSGTRNRSSSSSSTGSCRAVLPRRLLNRRSHLLSQSHPPRGVNKKAEAPGEGENKRILQQRSRGEEGGGGQQEQELNPVRRAEEKAAGAPPPTGVVPRALSSGAGQNRQSGNPPGEKKENAPQHHPSSSSSSSSSSNTTSAATPTPSDWWKEYPPPPALPPSPPLRAPPDLLLRAAEENKDPTKPRPPPVDVDSLPVGGGKSGANFEELLETALKKEEEERRKRLRLLSLKKKQAAAAAPPQVSAVSTASPRSVEGGGGRGGGAKTGSTPLSGERFEEASWGESGDEDDGDWLPPPERRRKLDSVQGGGAAQEREQEKALFSFSFHPEDEGERSGFSFVFDTTEAGEGERRINEAQEQERERDSSSRGMAPPSSSSSASSASSSSSSATQRSAPQPSPRPFLRKRGGMQAAFASRVLRGTGGGGAGEAFATHAGTKSRATVDRGGEEEASTAAFNRDQQQHRRSFAAGGGDVSPTSIQTSAEGARTNGGFDHPLRDGSRRGIERSQGMKVGKDFSGTYPSGGRENKGSCFYSSSSGYPEAEERRGGGEEEEEEEEEDVSVLMWGESPSDDWGLRSGRPNSSPTAGHDRSYTRASSSSSSSTSPWLKTRENWPSSGRPAGEREEEREGDSEKRQLSSGCRAEAGGGKSQENSSRFERGGHKEFQLAADQGNSSRFLYEEEEEETRTKKDNIRHASSKRPDGALDYSFGGGGGKGGGGGGGGRGLATTMSTDVCRVEDEEEEDNPFCFSDEDDEAQRGIAKRNREEGRGGGIRQKDGVEPRPDHGEMLLFASLNQSCESGKGAEDTASRRGDRGGGRGGLGRAVKESRHRLSSDPFSQRELEGGDGEEDIDWSQQGEEEEEEDAAERGQGEGLVRKPATRKMAVDSSYDFSQRRDRRGEEESFREKETNVYDEAKKTRRQCEADEELADGDELKKLPMHRRGDSSGAEGAGKAMSTYSTLTTASGGGMGGQVVMTMSSSSSSLPHQNLFSKTFSILSEDVDEGREQPENTKNRTGEGGGGDTFPSTPYPPSFGLEGKTSGKPSFPSHSARSPPHQLSSQDERRASASSALPPHADSQREEEEEGGDSPRPPPISDLVRRHFYSPSTSTPLVDRDAERRRGDEERDAKLQTGAMNRLAYTRPDEEEEEEGRGGIGGGFRSGFNRVLETPGGWGPDRGSRSACSVLPDGETAKRGAERNARGPGARSFQGENLLAHFLSPGGGMGGRVEDSFASKEILEGKLELLKLQLQRLRDGETRLRRVSTELQKQREEVVLEREKMRRGMEEERRLAWRELEASRQQLLREKRRVDRERERHRQALHHEHGQAAQHRELLQRCRDLEEELRVCKERWRVSVDRLRREKAVLQEENAALKEELSVAHAAQASNVARRSLLATRSRGSSSSPCSSSCRPSAPQAPGKSSSPRSKGGVDVGKAPPSPRPAASSSSSSSSSSCSRPHHSREPPPLPSPRSAATAGAARGVSAGSPFLLQRLRSAESPGGVRRNSKVTQARGGGGGGGVGSESAGVSKTGRMQGCPRYSVSGDACSTRFFFSSRRGGETEGEARPPSDNYQAQNEAADDPDHAKGGEDGRRRGRGNFLVFSSEEEEGRARGRHEESGIADRDADGGGDYRPRRRDGDDGTRLPRSSSSSSLPPPPPPPDCPRPDEEGGCGVYHHPPLSTAEWEDAIVSSIGPPVPNPFRPPPPLHQQQQQRAGCSYSSSGSRFPVDQRDGEGGREGLSRRQDHFQEEEERRGGGGGGKTLRVEKEKEWKEKKGQEEAEEERKREDTSASEREATTREKQADSMALKLQEYERYLQGQHALLIAEQKELQRQKEELLFKERSKLDCHQKEAHRGGGGGGGGGGSEGLGFRSAVSGVGAGGVVAGLHLNCCPSSSEYSPMVSPYPLVSQSHGGLNRRNQKEDMLCPTSPVDQPRHHGASGSHEDKNAISSLAYPSRDVQGKDFFSQEERDREGQGEKQGERTSKRREDESCYHQHHLSISSSSFRQTGEGCRGQSSPSRPPQHLETLCSRREPAQRRRSKGEEEREEERDQANSVQHLCSSSFLPISAQTHAPALADYQRSIPNGSHSPDAAVDYASGSALLLLQHGTLGQHGGSAPIFAYKTGWDRENLVAGGVFHTQTHRPSSSSYPSGPLGTLDAARRGGGGEGEEERKKNLPYSRHQDQPDSDEGPTRAFTPSYVHSPEVPCTAASLPETSSTHFFPPTAASSTPSAEPSSAHAAARGSQDDRGVERTTAKPGVFSSSSRQPLPSQERRNTSHHDALHHPNTTKSLADSTTSLDQRQNLRLSSSLAFFPSAVGGHLGAVQKPADPAHESAFSQPPWLPEGSNHRPCASRHAADQGEPTMPMRRLVGGEEDRGAAGGGGGGAVCGVVMSEPGKVPEDGWRAFSGQAVYGGVEQGHAARGQGGRTAEKERETSRNNMTSIHSHASEGAGGGGGPQQQQHQALGESAAVPPGTSSSSSGFDPRFFRRSMEELVGFDFSTPFQHHKNFLVQTLGSPGAVKQEREKAGRKEILYDSGHRRLVYGSGLQKLQASNGYTFVLFVNGDLRISSPDQSQIYHFAEQDILQYTLPDGKKFNRFSDGQREVQYPDGHIQILFANGVKKEIFLNKAEEITFPDGVQQLKFPPSKSAQLAGAPPPPPPVGAAPSVG